MKFDRSARRKVFSHGMTVLTGLAIVVIMIPLVAVIYEVVSLGDSVINVALFTQGIPYPCSPQPGITCQQGGLAVPIEGSLLLLGLASLYSVPIGIGAAIFSVEYGGERASARIVGLVADVLSGVPSIVAGAFIYALILIYEPTIVFSTLSGSLALSVLMIPIVARTCEEALRTVPNSVREAALALGISRWKTTLRIVLVSALPGIVTGVLLAIARAGRRGSSSLDHDRQRLCPPAPRHHRRGVRAAALDLLWGYEPVPELGQPRVGGRPPPARAYPRAQHRLAVDAEPIVATHAR